MISLTAIALSELPFLLIESRRELPTTAGHPLPCRVMG